MLSYPKSMLRLVTACALLTSTAAHAETIPVLGVYAGRDQIPPDVEVIVIDRFGGDLGHDTEIALADTLGNLVIRGEPHFRILTPTLMESEGAR